ncbi:hypothetical protein FHS82_001010 [Pseudochelatococcus lubricantis]|uniref:Uncharacterized protein n=1 Tax=Pseudochelatococcus lubricantis TaxID=1538102 RepID=A0ABX0UW52_9HYPH|nr:hypothetical protein [Pseudochelatococcus lubricantis]
MSSTPTSQRFTFLYAMLAPLLAALWLIREYIL